MTRKTMPSSIIPSGTPTGKKLASLCDAAVMVPSQRSARIQEAHVVIAHAWCETIDENLRENENEN